jgi:hypothetical protein
LKPLGIQSAETFDEALDAFGAQMRADNLSKGERVFLGDAELKSKFFPHFARFMARLFRERLEVRKARLYATVIGAAYNMRLAADQLPEPKWNTLLTFFQSQRESARTLGVAWPEPKGKWGGKSGHRAQFLAARDVLKAIAQ